MKPFLDLPLLKAPVVVLDTETTGLDPMTGDRIVEICALRFEPGPDGSWQTVGKIDQLIQPGRKMDPGASRINRIYDDDLECKPPFSQMADELMDLLAGCLIIAHNAKFDAKFLGLELYIDNLHRNDESRWVLDNPWLCTMQLARRNFRFGRNSLGWVVQSLGVPTGRAHRALNDVHKTAEIARRMSSRLARKRIRTVGDLLRAQGGPIYIPKLRPASLPSPLSEALNDGLALRIRYDDYTDGGDYVIEPRYSTTTYGRAYLIAFCREMRNQHTFRLDRITNAVLLKDRGTGGV